MIAKVYDLDFLEIWGHLSLFDGSVHWKAAQVWVRGGAGTATACFQGKHWWSCALFSPVRKIRVIKNLICHSIVLHITLSFMNIESRHNSPLTVGRQAFRSSAYDSWWQRIRNCFVPGSASSLSYVKWTSILGALQSCLIMLRRFPGHRWWSLSKNTSVFEKFS